MKLKAEEISAAIAEAIAVRLRADPPEEHDDEVERSSLVHRAEHDGFDEIWNSLIDEHGADAVLAALAPHKNDPLIAAAITHTCEIFNVRLRDYFTPEDIVGAAARHILTVPWWKAGIRDGGWLFSALWSHNYGTVDSFDDEEHFQLLVAVLERIPVDNDYALFVLGDGPLSHASAVFHDRIQELAKTHPQVARAWFLNLTDGQREFDAVAAAAIKGRSGDPVVVAVEISPDVTYGVVLSRLASHDDYLLDDLLRHTRWCEWEPLSTGNGGGVQRSRVTDTRGILRYSGKAPADATGAIIRHGGSEHRVAVKDGYFLFVDWDSDDVASPQVERFD